MYRSGVLMFVAGLAIVRGHNLWAWDWTVLVTMSGWLSLVLGLFRMFAAAGYRQGAAKASPAVFMGFGGTLARDRPSPDDHGVSP